MEKKSIANTTEKLLCDQQRITRMIARMAHQIIEKNSDYTPLLLLGIPTRGITLAHRLAQEISNYSPIPLTVGELDITLYRDDLAVIPHKNIRPTKVPPQGIDNAHIILVDDVLYTGRSVLSALDALRDIGRPRVIELAALIDRGHRQLPIRADYIGKNIPTSHDEQVHVLLHENDTRDAVILISPAGADHA